MKAILLIITCLFFAACSDSVTNPTASGENNSDFNTSLNVIIDGRSTHLEFDCQKYIYDNQSGFIKFVRTLDTLSYQMDSVINFNHNY